MRLSLVAPLAVMVAMAFANAAVAAPCKTPGSATASELLLDLRDNDVLFGMRIAFHVGLLPKAFPMENIAKVASPCSRGKPAGLAKPVEMFGENDGTPPRWAIASGDSQPYFFVAVMPKPAPALAWYDEPDGKPGQAIFKKSDMMSALIVIGKTGRRLTLAFFSETPSDDKIAALVKEYETGTRKALVAFDVETEVLAVNPVE